LTQQGQGPPGYCISLALSFNNPTLYAENYLALTTVSQRMNLAEGIWGAILLQIMESQLWKWLYKKPKENADDKINLTLAFPCCTFDEQIINSL
jgi:hypothetical protein